MLPLKDSPPRRSFPVVNVLIIAVNIYIFLNQVAMPDTELQAFVLANGLIPARLLDNLAAGNLAGLMPLVYYQFMHGGWLHIGSNMLYLWVFGDNIEDRLGHVKYLIFYLAVGVAAGLVQVFLDAGSTIPIIGASGAVAGVLGAYLISCPRARVLALVPIVFIFTVAELPAVVFLGFWFILQLFSGFAAIGANVSIAWWAHVGGFIIGLLLVSLMGKRVECE